MDIYGYSLSVFVLMFLWIAFFHCFKRVPDVHELEVIIIDSGDEQEEQEEQNK